MQNCVSTDFFGHCWIPPTAGKKFGKSDYSIREIGKVPIKLCYPVKIKFGCEFCYSMIMECQWEEQKFFRLLFETNYESEDMTHG